MDGKSCDEYGRRSQSSAARSFARRVLSEAVRALEALKEGEDDERTWIEDQPTAKVVVTLKGLHASDDNAARASPF